MPIDPRTPVLVGAAALQQQPEDPREACEALELMGRVLESAAEDAGSRALLAEVDSIWTPRGFWAYSDPGRLLAERFGAGRVRTIVAEIGILQTSVLGRAASAIQAGESDVAMITGAECRSRDGRLARQGLEVPTTTQSDATPDQVLTPDQEIMGELEIELGLITPAVQYAIIDNALRFAEGQSLAAHRAELGALWGDFNRVAVANPDAWNRTPMTGDEIVTPSETNRLLAYPYTKSLVSQWNVNQAGGLILCSLEKARRLGLDESRFVYPWAVVDSEHMVTLSERRALHRVPGSRLAAERACDHVGLGPSEIDHLELYSCFPAAVRVQQRELGLDPDRQVTRTGGMTFAGGPLNNFVVQAWVKMVETLRGDPGRSGLVTAISGLMTKQGVSVLGPEPNRPFLYDQVTKQAADAQERIRVERDARGRGRVSGYTVSTGEGAARGVALLVDLEQGGRALRVVDDEALGARGMSEELCGREVELGPDAEVRWL